MKPKVSVVVPVYNVEKYLRQCLDSIKNQTLKDIEVIVVDDGSKDSSGAIIDEYVAADSRFKAIHKPNSGYGNSMNRGFDAATGEYIGIIESDDYADDDMFEHLYEAAVKNKADVVKSNFYMYYSAIEEKSTFFEALPRKLCGKAFCPSKDLKLDERVNFHNTKPSIWSAIYRADFIRENGIRFLETPGASFQDTSFTFKVFSRAKVAYCLYSAYLHYRQDNASSSVNSLGKVYCVCDEYDEIARYIANDVPQEEKKALYAIMNRIKYDTYMWNLDRISDEFVLDFSKRMAEEYRAAAKEKQLDKRLFEQWRWDRLQWVASVPVHFSEHFIEERKLRSVNDRLNNLTNTVNGLNNRLGGVESAVRNGNNNNNNAPVKNGILKKARTALSVFRHEGFSGIKRVIKEKVGAAK